MRKEEVNVAHILHFVDPQGGGGGGSGGGDGGRLPAGPFGSLVTLESSSSAQVARERLLARAFGRALRHRYCRKLPEGRKESRIRALYEEKGRLAPALGVRRVFGEDADCHGFEPRCSLGYLQYLSLFYKFFSFF
jgi:hypothetical protein